MKILLDECVTKLLKAHLPAHNVFTVTQMRWNGLKNGELLSQCASAGFDVVLTIDKNISTQQNIAKYPLIIIVFHSVTSKIDELVQFIPSFEKALPEFRKGNLYVIEK